MEISISIEPYLRGRKGVLRKYLDNITELGRGSGGQRLPLSVHFDFFTYDGEVLQTVGGYADKIDIHLHSMVEDAAKLIADCSAYKFASISVHSDKIQDIVHVMNITNTIYGIVFDLDVENIADFADIIRKCRFATVMTVKSGASGQSFTRSALEKIAKLRKINPKIKIIVDGGINDQTISDVKKANADIAVVGSYAKKCYEANDLLGGIKKLLGK